MNTRYKFAAAATLLAGTLAGSLCVASPGVADPTPPPTTPQNSGPGYAQESYDLGHTVVYREAFQRFNGTGTPWNQACSTVVDEWQSLVGSEWWWNRDDALRGCVDGGFGPWQPG